MKRATALLAAAAIALTACTTAEPEAEASPTPEETTTYTPLTQEEWLALCAPDGGENPDDPKCQEDQEYIDSLSEDAGTEDTTARGDYYAGQQGEWFEYVTTDADSMIEEWEVKVDTAVITDSIPAAADNPEYYNGDADDPYTTAHAQPGHELLHVTYSAKNLTGKPSSLPLEATVLFSDGEEYAALGDDVTYGDNLTRQYETAAGDTQNPDTVSKGAFVIEIPEGSEIDALIIRDVYIMAETEWPVKLNL